MTKKTALNILIFVIVVAIAVVVYFLFFSEEERTPNQNNKEDRSPVVSNFFPESEDQDNRNNTEKGGENNQNVYEEIPVLRQISENPVSGFILIDEQSTTTKPGLPTETEDGEEAEIQDVETVEIDTIYRFMNRSNGNIMEATSKNLSQERITNTTIPKIYNAVFVSKDSVVIQYLNELNTVRTSFIKLINQEDVEEDQNNNASSTATTTTPRFNRDFSEIQTTNLSDGINNVISKDGVVLYTASNQSDSLNGFVFDEKTPETNSLVFNTDIEYLNIYWDGNNDLLFGTKPSINASNYLFEYDTNTESRNKILSAGPAFSFLPNNDFSLILFSDTSAQLVNSYVYNTETDEYSFLDNGTFPGEKCVWSQLEVGVVFCAIPQETLSELSLISWYRGETSFNDVLYKINVLTGEQDFIEEFDGEFDVIKPQLSENEEYFVFINKKDLSLWSLKISDK